MLEAGTRRQLAQEVLVPMPEWSEVWAHLHLLGWRCVAGTGLEVHRYVRPEPAKRLEAEGQKIRLQIGVEYFVCKAEVKRFAKQHKLMDLWPDTGATVVPSMYKRPKIVLDSAEDDPFAPEKYLRSSFKLRPMVTSDARPSFALFGFNRTSSSVRSPNLSICGHIF
jgi:hypothetical protein